MRSRPILALASLAILGACSETDNPMSPTDLTFAGAGAATPSAKGSGISETIYGLSSDNTLIMFSTSKPNQTSSSVAISGLAAGETVIGIDFRPSDLNANGTNDVGKLYGVTDASRIYVIDPTTGAASSPITMTVALTGTVVGMGFNPVPDRLRIHTTTDQNLRINVDNGAVTVDGVLTYGAGDVSFGTNPQLTATGYTNNDNDLATGTALYAIDAGTDALVTFPTSTGGPNGGVIATVGALGVNAGAATGFDISLQSGVAYAAIATSPSGKSTIYSIDLATGSAVKIGMLAQTSSALLGIAIAP